MTDCSTIRSSARSAMNSYMPGTVIRDAGPSGRRWSGARGETALWLVGPTGYASAEHLYDGDSYLIACELGMTVQVAEDHKSLLAGHVALTCGEGTME